MGNLQNVRSETNHTGEGICIVVMNLPNGIVIESNRIGKSAVMSSLIINHLFLFSWQKWASVQLPVLAAWDRCRRRWTFNDTIQSENSPSSRLPFWSPFHNQLWTSLLCRSFSCGQKSLTTFNFVMFSCRQQLQTAFQGQWPHFLILFPCFLA